MPLTQYSAFTQGADIIRPQGTAPFSQTIQLAQTPVIIRADLCYAVSTDCNNSLKGGCLGQPPQRVEKVKNLEKCVFLHAEQVSRNRDEFRI